MVTLRAWSGVFAVVLATPWAEAGPQGPVGASSSSPPSYTVAPSPFVVPYEKLLLDNGLEVILHSDSSLPLVAVNLWYHVGPANEPTGRSGFAHLFEHLMYEGSKHVGRRFDPLLESAGATRVNGTTSWDRTNYFETVPRQHLELVLWLESDRMGFLLDALDQERLDVQRDVVKNERRQSYENAPYGPSDLAMYDLLFPPGHPYHGAVIGSMEDLSRATLEDVRRFFRDYYVPSNATLTLAGDFDVAHARSLVERYFGSLPRRPRPSAAAPPTGPLPGAARVEVAERVELARVAIAWATPPAFSDADVALDLATSILGHGRTSRLYRDLVVARRLCSRVGAWVDSAGVASTTSVEALVLRGATPEAAEAAIDEVVRKLGADGPTARELARAKRGARVSVLSSLQALDGGGGETGRAGTLQRMNHYLGDPGALEAQMARLEALTSADVQRAVREHLSEHRAVVITRPTAPGALP